MDMDWCLTCDRHLQQSSPAPYCSALCMPIAGPSRYYQQEEEDSDEEEEMVHQIYYTGNDYSGIEAWAHNVVPGAPEQAPITRSRAPSSASSSRSSSRKTTTLKPPSLLSARRPLAPTLSFTPTAPKQAPPKPSLPLNTPTLPSSSYSSYSRPHSVAYSSSTGQDSSALATPVSGNNAGYVQSHVVGWEPSSKESFLLPPRSKPIPAVYNRGRMSGRAVA